MESDHINCKKCSNLKFFNIILPFIADWINFSLRYLFSRGDRSPIPMCIGASGCRRREGKQIHSDRSAYDNNNNNSDDVTKTVRGFQQPFDQQLNRNESQLGINNRDWTEFRSPRSTCPRGRDLHRRSARILQSRSTWTLRDKRFRGPADTASRQVPILKLDE